MTWHSALVSTDRLTGFLMRIRAAGGTITRYQPGADGVRLTWTMLTGLR